MDDYNQPMSEEDMEMMKHLMGTTPVPEDKQNQFTFINNVVTATDTTRVGNVTIEELGMPHYPIRVNKEMALIANKICDNTLFTEFFLAESEITTGTSLSKDGFLTKLAFTQKREIADVTKRKKTANKGWFRKKEPAEEQGGGEGGYYQP